MNLKQCETKIWETYQKDPWLLDNVSVFTRKARWENKVDCLKLMWSYDKIKSFIKTSKDNNKVIYTPNWEKDTVVANDNKTTTTHNSAYQTSTIKQDSVFLDYWNDAKDYGMLAVKIFFLTILLISFMKLIHYFLIFIYDVVNAKRMIYLKVLLPRWDWKLDRERAKEIAKDMKEKIWRMSQIFKNLHKLWELSFMDTLMRKIFNKPKIVLMLHYEWWQMFFIVWTYPEYKEIIEWAISAQYSEWSIETIAQPVLFPHKNVSIMPMSTKKEPAYTIKMYKQLPDDPINNIIDAIAKVPTDDSFSIVMPIKPVWDKFNKRALKVATALFKKDKKVLKKRKLRHYIIFPRKILDFFLHWPSQSLIDSTSNPFWAAEWWDKYIRMVKAQEDAYNAMWEEAANPAFENSILLITTSENKERLKNNINLVVSAYNVYMDQYTNQLDNPQNVESLLRPIVLFLWRIWIIFNLTKFFYSRNVFTINELASLFHFPDATYNRSNIISWMQYKVLPAPSNLPQFSDFNWYIMSWIIAEDYKWWKLSDILFEYRKHPAVWKKIVEDKKLVLADKLTKKQLKWKNIIEKDWKQYVEEKTSKEVYWYKLSKEWVLLWLNIYRNRYEPVYMNREDRTRHHYCIWKSWTWKSVYLQNIARQDMWNWDWICVIDPHWDLVEDLLAYIPKERAKDVIFFDAWNEDRPMWLNLYEIENIDEADRTVNDATEMFIKMFWPEIFWPRIQEYFKFGSLTLLEDFEDRPTILDVPRLFTDDAYREFKTKNVKNPVVRNFWEKTFNAMWDREKKEIIPYFTSKFVSFNTNRLIRNIIWQTHSAFKLDDVMNNRKILLISLSKWKIWDMNAQLLWMIIVSKIYTAAMARAKIPEKERKDFYLYVDEFQNFVSGTFADILSEARKYRLCLIMAHQYIKQLESWQWLNKSAWWKWDVKAAVFGNVWTMQSFKVGAPDAEFLEKEYAPVLSQQDIIWIANYKAYIKLNINNSTTRPFSMNSIWTQDYQNKKIVPILKEYSAKKHWRKRKFVDMEISAKLWLDVEDLDKLWDWEMKLWW